MSDQDLQPTAESAAGEPERLQKVLAKAGLGSRRVCEEMIADGRVTVNGVVAQLGQRADGAREVIAVDGIRYPGARLGVLPGQQAGGVICTASDPQGRPTVTALVPAEPRVYPVGGWTFRPRG